MGSIYVRNTARANFATILDSDTLSKWLSDTSQKIKSEEMLIKIHAHYMISGRGLSKGMFDLLVPTTLPIASCWTHRVGDSHWRLRGVILLSKISLSFVFDSLYQGHYEKGVPTLLRVMFTPQTVE